MNQITEKIKNSIGNDLKNLFPNKLNRDEKQVVERFIDAHIKTKSAQYYNNGTKDAKSLADILKELVIEKPDSKAEMIFFDALKKAEISFKFQYKIGPYRVDYLIGDDLVFELDGPMHLLNPEYDKNRKQYIESMGYEVYAVPLWMIAVAPNIVIDEIKKRLEDK